MDHSNGNSFLLQAEFGVWYSGADDLFWFHTARNSEGRGVPMTAVITGSASGIGAAIRARLEKAGDKILETLIDFMKAFTIEFKKVKVPFKK